MENTKDDLTYIKQLLEGSQRPNGYPMIYFMWGCIVFVGYLIIEFAASWSTSYWVAAPIAGFFASMWIGIRGDQKTGQTDSKQGRKYVAHFGLLLGFILLAIVTSNPSAILLLIGFGYCLAGLYLEKLMLPIGVLAATMYIASHMGWIHSNLILGAVFALGFFVVAWSSARNNANKIATPSSV